ncbi:very short patch repair endonuclease [Phragmitibacter flavus]|nr:very short patch repair endonuclease [Phragmitibacter flavus]
MMGVFKELGVTGWRRHLEIKTPKKDSQEQRLKVRPDFVFRKARVAVFVDGCFWHGCPKCYVSPKGNQEFWDTKKATNAARDRKVNRILKAAGWKVVRVWEHELKRVNEKRLRLRLRRVFPEGGVGGRREVGGW